MHIDIHIDLDNAAFEYNPELEVARILRRIADRVSREGLEDHPNKLIDINGNTTGTFEFNEE